MKRSFVALFGFIAVAIVIGLIFKKKGDDLAQMSNIHPMDSYLIYKNNQKFLYVTSLETPIKVTNQKLPIRIFEIIDERVEERAPIPKLEGYHTRSVFQTEPPNADVYFVDHGIDVEPFPGGGINRFDQMSGEFFNYSDHEGKFNFSGDAIFYKGVKYEVLVGFNFVKLLINENLDERMNEALKEMGEPQGFLTSTFFEYRNELFLFLGISDIYPKDYDESERFDFLLKISSEKIQIQKLARPVPWNWATVYSEVSYSELAGGNVLKVTYHDPGFNQPRLGYYPLSDKLTFHEIPIKGISDLSNVWVPKFEFVSNHPSGFPVLGLVRSGSGGGKYGLLRLSIDGTSDSEFEEKCLVGMHLINNQLYALTCELGLIKI